MDNKSYEIILRTKEPFRVGGVSDPLSGAENPVTIVGSRAVIPGPSLKGAYRAELERYLIEQYFDKDAGKWEDGKDDFKPCIPSPEKQLSNDERKLIERGMYKASGCHYPCDPKPYKCGNTLHTICPVCYLLGANGLPGVVRVPFLFSDVTADELYSARIDRAVGTVTPGTNRPYSVIPDGSVFKGILTVMQKNDILKWHIGQARNWIEERSGKDAWLIDNELPSGDLIQNLIVERIENINILGGFKSKGCGKVEISVSEI